MTIYAIDPGTEESALVEMHNQQVTGDLFPNVALLAFLRSHAFAAEAHLVIEQIESFGMAVGKEVFETVFWAGRFAEAWDIRGGTWSMLPRRRVKLTLCGSMRAKDTNIRQALIDRYGGPACAKKGGPLAGIKSHLWSALALAVTFQDTQRQEAT